MTELPEMPDFLNLSLPDDFDTELDSIEEFYGNTTRLITEQKSRLKAESDGAYAKDPVSYEEWEHGIFDQWEETIREQEKLSGQLVIVFLEVLVREWLNDIRPSERSARRRKRGDKWHDTVERELKDKYAVSLTDFESWKGLKELFYARDAVIHRQAFSDYASKYPSGRFIDREENLTLPPTLGDSLFHDVRDFKVRLEKALKPSAS